MPQYDTDPGILNDRCYAHAQHIILTDGYYEDWDALSDRRATMYREGLREELLYEFPTLAGPEIAANMDDALSEFGFPFHRA